MSTKKYTVEERILPNGIGRSINLTHTDTVEWYENSSRLHIVLYPRAQLRINDDDCPTVLRPHLCWSFAMTFFTG